MTPSTQDGLPFTDTHHNEGQTIHEAAAAPSRPRRAAYAQEGIRDPRNPEHHMVIFADEGEAGYLPTTYTGTLDYCESVAESINTERGLTRADVLTIVSSTMAAQNAAGRGSGVIV